MFLKKKPRTKSAPKITLFDAHGNRLIACALSDYPLEEPLVLSLSMEYFQDPDPCAIHRGAVHKRCMMEIAECMQSGKRVSVSSLPETVRRYFPSACAFAEYTEE